MGVPVIDLSPQALTDKLVRRLRGGYCFEQNGLMAHVLTQLGFGVDALEIREKWEPLYLFSTRPFPMIDRQVGSWYVSTYPESGFVTGLSVALVTDEARWNLRGRNLAIHGKGGSERIRFDTAADVVTALTERFGLDLTGLGDVEARVSEVMDT
jgi:arylamine N-acetyltransferase